MLPRITLAVVEGAHRGEERTFTGRGAITVGRSAECDFRLCGHFEDLLVSRRHCLLAVHPDRVEVRDLESSNGTFLNGRRVGFRPGGSTVFRRRLRDGDQLRVGAALLQVRVEGPPAEEAAATEAEVFSA
jgi:serine/threonine-protein kinase